MATASDPPHRPPRAEHERRPYYKYVNSNVAKTILRTRKLRWSSPILFNDSFDVPQELPLNFDEAELSKALAEKVALLVEQGGASSLVSNPDLAIMLDMATKVNPDVRSEIVRDLRQNSDTATLRQIQVFAQLREKWRQIVPKLRILCLSEFNDITPMWQHYADGCKGVVLRFESLDEADSAFLLARKVDYQDFPIDISNVETWVNCLLAGEAAFHDQINKYQHIKATSWEYEGEWRIVGGDRQGETELFADYGFNPRTLTGIYFGTQCSPKDREDMLSLLVHDLGHVSTYEAFEDRHQGKFDFRPFTR